MVLLDELVLWAGRPAGDPTSETHGLVACSQRALVALLGLVGVATAVPATSVFGLAAAFALAA